MSDKTGKAPPHSAQDHAQGLDAHHHHEHHGLYDHDHDHDHFDVPDDHRHDLISLGVDVGTATTQLVFARLHLDHLGEAAQGRHVASAEEILHRAPPALTPYRDGERIDAEALDARVDAAFAAAGLHPDQVDSGVVILTGAALRDGNAAAIGGLLAERVGDLVSVAAGHRVEAILAAFGSGAAAASALGAPVLCCDIGGATTKLTRCEGGRVTATASLGLGARLATEREGRVAAASEAAAALGVAARLGDDFAALAPLLAERMATLILAALTDAPGVPQAWWAAPPSGPLAAPRVLFSGGVGEYLRGETRGFGDLGLALGAALFARLPALPLERVAARECLLATALGAAAFSVQRSGAATHISEPAALLPRRDLRVLRPHLPAGADAASLAAAIGAHLAANGAPGREPLALALTAAAAEPLAEALAACCADVPALYLFTEGEGGRALGAALAARLPATPLMVVDGIALWELDFVDCGRLRLPSGTVPITVKSLVFGDDPRAAQPPRR